MASAVSNGSGKAAVKSPYEKYDEIVKKNPLDFNSWVQLLTLVDTEVRKRDSFPYISNDIFCIEQPSMTRDTVVSTYNRFLNEFPLCFGYWNKVRKTHLLYKRNSSLVFISVCTIRIQFREKKCRGDTPCR